MARPSPQELLVFQTALLQADLSVAQLARQLKMQEHTVRRALDALREKGVFLGRRPYLSPSALGMIEYVIYLSLVGQTKGLRTSFVKALCDNDHVFYVGEVGGDYQYEVGFFSRGSSDLADFLDSLISQFKAKIQTSAIAIVHEDEYSGMRYVTDRAPKVKPLRRVPTSKVFRIDETDHKILSMLGNSCFESYQEISRRLNLSPSTVAYRIKNFEKSGLITGYCYVYDSKPLGSLPSILLVSANIMTKAQKNELLKYCRDNRQITAVELTIGAWQARIHSQAAKYEDALNLIHELNEKFPGDIQGIRVLPQMQFYKYTLYPFKRFDSVTV